MPEPSRLEIFQDLKLIGPLQERSRLREVLLIQVKAPWRHASNKEEELSLHVDHEDEVLLFERASKGGLPAAGLVLWPADDGYEVTNIVPIKSGSLSYSTYNAILQDFAKKIAEPAAQSTGFTLYVSASHKSLEDWLTPSAAKYLHRFSALANKSTGAAHPMDKKRWLTFLIAAHQDNRAFDAGLLARWLIEAEHWPEDTAHELAIEYEFALELLEQYDQTR